MMTETVMIHLLQKVTLEVISFCFENARNNDLRPSEICEVDKGQTAILS